MTSPVRVSIVIPVYNGANYMREAIDSALAQTWPHTEVVVVNDGSRDDGATLAIARSYGDRIRLIDKPNGGVASALNAGIAAMTGDVFCWLSHDDRHHPGKTAAQVEDWLTNGRRQEVLYSNYRLIDAAGTTIADVELDHAMLTAKPLYALLRGSIHGCSVFVPKHILDAVGGFDETLPTTQDYDLWRRVIARFPFRHMQDVLIDSRWHDEQGSKKIDHVVEATQFWLATVAGVPAQDKVACEGSELRFDREMAKFLRKNLLTDAADQVEARAEVHLAETLISVVMPVYNRAVLALGAVASLKNQTHANWELIVVDDGSTEDMRLLIEAIAALGDRARYVRQDNAGPGAARNAGWRLARGTYVAFLDSDDLFLPTKLAEQLRAMEEAGAAFSHTSYHRYWQGGGDFTLFPSGTGNSFPGIIGSCGIATPTVMLRRTLIVDGLCFPTDFHIGEDVSLWVSVAVRHGILGLPAALSIVRTGKSASAYDPAKARQGIENILGFVRQHAELSQYPVEIERLQRLRDEISDGENGL